MLKKILVFLIFIIFLLQFLVSSQDQKLIIEAQECDSEPCAKILLAKYENIEDTNKELYQIIVYHNLAASGNELYLDRAVALAKKNHEVNSSPWVMIYYGSCLTILAEKRLTHNDPMGALESLQQGLDLIDGAVNKSPQDLNLRAIRLSHSEIISQASPIDRYPKIKEDIEFLYSQWSQLNSIQQSMFYYYDALVKIKENQKEEAMNCLKKAFQISPKSTYGQQASKMISEWKN